MTVSFIGMSTNTEQSGKCEEPRFNQEKQTPHKVVLYFPIIPCLQCLYANKKDAEHLRCHKDRKLVGKDDDVLRHTANGLPMESTQLLIPGIHIRSKDHRVGCEYGWN